MIYITVMIIHVCASLVLIAVILLQAGKGGGLSEMFGGGATQNLFGTSATSFLTRATSVCAVMFIIASLALAILSGKRERSLMDNVSIPAPTGQTGTPAPETPQPQGEPSAK